MRSFHYAFRQVFKARWMVFVKLLSLTLGLTLAGFMFTYVAFMTSYDNTSDSDRLYQIRVKYDVANKGADYGDRIMMPVVPKILETVSGVETGTRFWNESDREIHVEDKTYAAKVIRADSMFFKTMGYTVLRGVPSEVMTTSENVFVSQTLAKNMCGSADPIGFGFTSDGHNHVICGVFEDIAQNRTYQFDMVLPLVHLRTEFDGGDSWYSYLKLPETADTGALAKQINQSLDPYQKSWEDSGYKLSYYLKPIKDVHYDQVKNTILILSILSLVLILVSGLNYVLLSLASLASRAKEVGVHKVNGAGKGSVFGIIIWETAIYIALATVCSAMLLWAFKSEFNNLAQVDLWSVFSFGNFWAIGIVIMLTLFTAGVIPAWLFCKIPVTQVFRAATNLRSSWKKILLLFQFASSAFVLCFLVVIMKQHKEMLTADLGYNYNNIVVMSLSAQTDDFELLSNKLREQSFVEGLTFSANIPLDGLSGAMFRNQSDTTGNSISVRYMIIDSVFLNVYKIKMAVGSGDLNVKGNIVVNKEFVNTFGGTRDPLGMSMLCEEISDNVPLRVTGVMDHFKVGDMRVDNEPMTFWVFDLGQVSVRHKRYVSMLLSDVSKDNIEKLLNVAKGLFPQEKIEIKSYSQMVDESYYNEKSLRDGVLLAAITLLLITLLGVVGYVATEIKRKSKEIAVRRVHGASSWSVVFVIMTPLLILSSIGVVIGAVLSLFMSNYWLKNFSYQTDLSWWIYVATSLGIIGILVVTVAMQSAKIARQNPAVSIKKE